MESMQRLLDIMARLRDPEAGCPWDREQGFSSLVPHTLEEAYEVADAVEQGDPRELCDELGDLLFQVVFYARVAEEQGSFDFEDVAEGIARKLVRRHPHVFGEEAIGSASEQTRAWERHKARERAERARARGFEPSLLDGVSLALPALSRARKLQARAARVGFDWPEADAVFPKLEEESRELREALAAGGEPAWVEAEVGDLLFTCVNLARHLEVDPETALRRANQRFERRFRGVEEGLRAAGREPADATLEEMDGLWEATKGAEPGRR